MKPFFKSRWLPLLLVPWVGCGLVARSPAQTFTTLHNFMWTANGGVNYGGAGPFGDLALSGGTLYGLAFPGGTNGWGTIFRLNTDGTGATAVYNFTSANLGGDSRLSGLVLSGSMLYGTTYAGGNYIGGTVFRIATNGMGFTALHQFIAPGNLYYPSTDGAFPASDPVVSDLVLSGATLYGTAKLGGTAGAGTLFKVGTTGTGFAVLHNFTLTNSDGGYPIGRLIVSGNTLFGTAPFGGSLGGGSIFSVTTAGAGFTTLYNFTNGGSGSVSTFSGNTLYGVADGGAGSGLLFAINTNGTGFRNLHTFTTRSVSYPYANTDGADATSLIVSGNTLYGAAYGGGRAGNGTVFALNTDGTGFTVLHDFTPSDSFVGTNADGAAPLGGLVLSGNTLYGAAGKGGAFGSGTVFCISLPVVQPQLTLAVAGTDVVLTWPTTPIGFTLESTANLVPPVAWTPVSPPPVLVSGQNTVTNPISAVLQFYRLSQ